MCVRKQILISSFGKVIKQQRKKVMPNKVLKIQLEVLLIFNTVVAGVCVLIFPRVL